eukprot:COSAG03_NODE_2826_length_2428_cov_1.355088_2_plen_87_part_00
MLLRKGLIWLRLLRPRQRRHTRVPHTSARYAAMGLEQCSRASAAAAAIFTGRVSVWREHRRRLHATCALSTRHLHNPGRDKQHLET